MISEILYISVPIILIITTVILSIINPVHRNDVIDKLHSLLTMPFSSISPENSNIEINENIKFYSWDTYHNINQKLPNIIIKPIKNGFSKTKLWFSKNFEKIHNGYPEKTFGYILLFFVFLLFAYADLVTISQTVPILGYSSNPNSILSKFLDNFSNYEFSIAIGSFVSILTGAFVSSEIFEESKFTDWDEKKGFFKTISKFLTIFVIIVSFVIIISLGLERFRTIANLTPEFFKLIGNWSQFVVLILIPINATISAFLIHREALNGLFTIILALPACLILGILLFFRIISQIFCILPTATELIHRFLLGLFLIIFIYLLSPIYLILNFLPNKEK